MLRPMFQTAANGRVFQYVNRKTLDLGGTSSRQALNSKAECKLKGNTQSWLVWLSG